VQLEDEREPFPVAMLHAMLPAGTSVAPVPVFDTTTVQVADSLTASVVGAQFAALEVTSWAVVSVPLPVLAEWSESPPYEADTVCAPLEPASGV
jgi:hypothetical protein